MADINVLDLPKATEAESGDVLMLIRTGADGTQNAMQIPASGFKGEKGASGTLNSVALSRNRLVAVLGD